MVREMPKGVHKTGKKRLGHTALDEYKLQRITLQEGKNHLYQELEGDS